MGLGLGFEDDGLVPLVFPRERRVEEVLDEGHLEI